MLILKYKMNNDIFLLGNPSKLIGCVSKKENDEHIKSFIKEHNVLILEYIKSCFTTPDSIDNKRLERKLYDFVEEYIHFYNTSIKEKEICTSVEKKNYTQEESIILHKAFMNLKQNRQKTIMQSFANHKTVSLVSSSSSSKSNIQQQSTSKIHIHKQNDKNDNDKQIENGAKESNNFNSIDLSDKI